MSDIKDLEKMLNIIKDVSSLDERMKAVRENNPEIFKEYDSILKGMKTIKIRSGQLLEESNKFAVQYESTPCTKDGYHGVQVDMNVDMTKIKTTRDIDVAVASMMDRIETDTGMDRYSYEFLTIGEKTWKKLNKARKELLNGKETKQDKTDLGNFPRNRDR